MPSPGINTTLPDLIVGPRRFRPPSGASYHRRGRNRPPRCGKSTPDRQTGAEGYQVVHPDDDERRDYRSIYDASGVSGLLDTLIGRLAKGGEVVLAGFYPEPLSFAFPPAFMREARFRIAAEWTRDDLVATRDLIDHGALSLDNLISHRVPAADAAQAYQTAFEDSACLKMILNWGALKQRCVRAEKGERRMSLDVPNLKDYDNKLREEANEPTLEVPQGEPTKKRRNHRDLRQGGIGKVLHARQSQPHDGRNRASACC